MADVQIPQELAALQRRVNEAFDALEAHRQQVGLPGREWPEEETRRSVELLAAARAAAAELRAAVDATGLEQEHGSYRFQAALMEASRDQT